MKYPLTENTVDVPENVTISVKSRKVTVKGPLGELTREFKYASVDIIKVSDKQIKLQMWMAGYKQKASVNSIASQIKNMIRGVTHGYKFKMTFAYNHFPIQALVHKGGKQIEVKNFLGEKRNRIIDALPGVTLSRNDAEKNIITVTGNDLNHVSQTCALIHQSVLVKHKDIRQFLDGIYVQEARLNIQD